MKTSEKFEDMIEKEIKKRENDGDLLAQSVFLSEMKKQGLVSPQKYRIPPLDTIGKRRYLSLTKRGK